MAGRCGARGSQKAGESGGPPAPPGRSEPPRQAEGCWLRWRQGWSNKRHCRAGFSSAKATVERHLATIYRKLGGAEQSTGHPVRGLYGHGLLPPCGPLACPARASRTRRQKNFLLPSVAPQFLADFPGGPRRASGFPQCWQNLPAPPLGVTRTGKSPVPLVAVVDCRGSSLLLDLLVEAAESGAPGLAGRRFPGPAWGRRVTHSPPLGVSSTPARTPTARNGGTG